MVEQNTINWEKFDKTVDLTGIQEEIDAASKGGNYPDIPPGEYEVSVLKMELGQSKKKNDGSGGDPMLKIQFEILDGQYKGNRIFYNGVMQPWNTDAIGVQTHRNNEILRGLSDDESVKFESYAQYNELILDIAEDITGEEAWEYLLKKDVTKTGFDTYEILDIFE